MAELLNKKNRLIWWLGYYLFVAIKQWVFGWYLLWWFLGGLIAYFFRWIDWLTFVYVLRPHAEVSEQVRYYFDHRQWQAGLQALRQRHEEMPTLMGLSIVFLVVWVPLSLYLLTSTGSWFARGLVMGIGLRAVLIMLQHWNRLPVMKQKLFWQIKRELSDQETRWTVGLFMGAFIGLSLLI